MRAVTSMWQAYHHDERAPIKHIWKPYLRSLVNQNAVYATLFILVIMPITPCVTRYQIGSGAMATSSATDVQKSPIQNQTFIAVAEIRNPAKNVTDSIIIPDDLASVATIRSSTILPTDSAVHDAESEDASIHKVSKTLSESLATDVVTKVKDILDFYLESVKI
jgi:hypothetical protein